MIYNVLFLTNEVESTIHSDINNLFKDIEEKFNRSFNFQVCAVNENDIIKKAKSAHAVLLDSHIDTKVLRTLSKELTLHTEVRKIGNVLLVNDAFGGIYSHEKGFRNNSAFGREAYDTECFSELEIERTARVAYELAPTRHITLIDKADELATSKLWRKIVTDINEDYPFVTVDMCYIQNAFENISENKSDTLLTTNLFGDIIAGYLKASVGKQEFSAYVGDTTLAICKVGKNAKSGVAFLLRHSFDMQAEAEYLER